MSVGLICSLYQVSVQLLYFNSSYYFVQIAKSPEQLFGIAL